MSAGKKRERGGGGSNSDDPQEKEDKLFYFVTAVLVKSGSLEANESTARTQNLFPIVAYLRCETGAGIGASLSACGEKGERPRREFRVSRGKPLILIYARDKRLMEACEVSNQEKK